MNGRNIILIVFSLFFIFYPALASGVTFSVDVDSKKKSYTVKTQKPKKKVTSPASSSKKREEEKVSLAKRWNVNFELKKDEIIITWKPFEGTLYYILLIFGDPIMFSLLWTKTTKETKAIFPKEYSFDKPIYLLIKSVDKDGKVISAFRTSSLITAPKSDLISSVSIETRQVKRKPKKKKQPPIKVRHSFSQNFSWSSTVYRARSTSNYSITNIFNINCRSKILNANINFSGNYSNSLRLEGPNKGNAFISMSISLSSRKLPVTFSYSYSTFSRGLEFKSPFRSSSFHLSWRLLPRISLSSSYFTSGQRASISGSTSLRINPRNNLSASWSKTVYSKTFSVSYSRRY